MLRKLLTFVLIGVLLTAGIGACTEKEDDPWTNSDGTAIVCRRNDCGQAPLYHEWNRRYCAVHIEDFHYCRYPDCHNTIPNSKDASYCTEYE